MDISRKAYSRLLQWKNATPVSKAILIKGARRVGKSYLAETFAKNEYSSYILIDFASRLFQCRGAACPVLIEHPVRESLSRRSGAN